MNPFKHIKQIIKFLHDVANDPRIPKQDKVILVTLIGLIISPVDILPDWIPIIGQIDDFIILSVILNYFFEVLDTEILLNHYPYGMKSFLAIKRSAKLFSHFTPNFLKKKIWSYTGNVYKP